MSFKRCIAVFLASLFWISAQAGTKILDVELGVSTVDEVRKIASAAGKVQNNGTNDWTRGPSFAVQQGNYGIDGLQSVQYVFDTSGKLVGVFMTMAKHRTDDIFDVLAGKYKLVKKVRPYVGDQYAKFNDSGTIIELEAPHLSFQMEVRYMTPAFVKTWEDGTKNQAQQKRAQEKAKF